MDEKKKRGSNFSDKEINNLMKCVLADINIIENKLTDGANTKDKQICWKKITDLLNSCGESFRDTSSLKIKYENIKRTLKKKISNTKKHYMGTGGGPEISTPLTWYEEQLYAHLQLGIEGLPSVGDSDEFRGESSNNIIIVYEEEKENTPIHEEELALPSQSGVNTDMCKIANNPVPPKALDVDLTNENYSSSTKSTNWNLKRKRKLMTEKQKQSNLDAFSTLAEKKTEMCSIQTMSYEVDLKQKQMDFQRREEEWNLKKKILEEEYAECVAERTRTQILFELTREEKLLKLEIMKCELNTCLKNSLK